MQEIMTQPYPAVDQPKSNCDPTSCPTQPNPTEAQLYPAAAERERERDCHKGCFLQNGRSIIYKHQTAHFFPKCERILSIFSEQLLQRETNPPFAPAETQPAVR